MPKILSIALQEGYIIDGFYSLVCAFYVSQIIINLKCILAKIEQNVCNRCCTNAPLFTT